MKPNNEESNLALEGFDAMTPIEIESFVANFTLRSQDG